MNTVIFIFIEYCKTTCELDYRFEDCIIPSEFICFEEPDYFTGQHWIKNGYPLIDNSYIIWIRPNQEMIDNITAENIAGRLVVFTHWVDPRGKKHYFISSYYMEITNDYQHDMHIKKKKLDFMMEYLTDDSEIIICSCEIFINRFADGDTFVVL